MSMKKMPSHTSPTVDAHNERVGTSMPVNKHPGVKPGVAQGGPDMTKEFYGNGMSGTDSGKASAMPSVSSKVPKDAYTKHVKR